MLVGADFIGRGHVETNDVLDQRQFGLLSGIDVEHPAGHLVTLVDLAAREKKIERAQAAATGCNVEHPLFLGRDNDQVLQQALGLDAGGEFLDKEVAVVLADIGFGKPQLAEWDHLDIVHHGSPETGMAEPIGSTPSSPPPLTVSGFPWSWNGNVGRLMARCANAACSDGEA